MIRQALLGAAMMIAAATSSAASVSSPQGHFAFFIDPWVALHHLAYHYAREQATTLKLRGRVRLADADREALNSAMRPACGALSRAYLPYVERSLLHDAATRGLAEALTQGPDQLTDESVRKALQVCMPAYQEHRWPAHKAASEQLLGDLLAQLVGHEEEMAANMVRTLGAPWPDAPIRVDVVPYANWAGAYTFDPPPRITLANNNAEVSGCLAFELLFHEAAHTATFGRPIVEATHAALTAHGIRHEGAWHAVLFHAVGSITSNVLREAGHTPYATALGLTQQTGNRDVYAALEATWHLGGNLRERTQRMAAALAARQRDTAVKD